MATITEILSTDNATDAVGKINTNFSNLNQEGGGGSTPTPATGILARNQDAVERILAAKKYVHETADGGGMWDKQNNTGLFIVAHGSDFHTDNVTLDNFLTFVEGFPIVKQRNTSNSTVVDVPGIDAAVITGDFVNTFTNTFAAEAAVVKGVLDDHTVKPLMCIGNHERGGSMSVSDITSALGFGSITPTGGSTSNGYYYKDYTTKNLQTGADQQKIRIIVINQYDHPTSNAKADAEKTGTYSSTQITWLLGVLDDAIDKGYAVLVAMHAAETRASIIQGDDNPFYQHGDRWSGGAVNACSGPLIEDIIAAFRAGGTVSGTYTFNKAGNSTVAPQVTINHTFDGAGHFIAFMDGHTHTDRIGYSSVHPDLLHLMCSASCCMSNAAGGVTYSIGEEASDLPRMRGTKTEDCFNVYGIDTVHKTVRVVRVGASVNDRMDKRELACYEYEPSV